MDKLTLLFILSALAVLTLALCSSSRSQPVETQDWRLVQFIDHLRAAGLRAKAVPANEEGRWGNTVYLSEDPAATWSSFQLKNRNVERIDQWQGAVWIEHLRKEGDTEWDVARWGRHGCQIGRFVVFGDARLVERIIKAFGR